MSFIYNPPQIQILTCRSFHDSGRVQQMYRQVESVKNTLHLLNGSCTGKMLNVKRGSFSWCRWAAVGTLRDEQNPRLMPGYGKLQWMSTHNILKRAPWHDFWVYKANLRSRLNNTQRSFTCGENIVPALLTRLSIYSVGCATENQTSSDFFHPDLIILRTKRQEQKSRLKQPISSRVTENIPIMSNMFQAGVFL